MHARTTATVANPRESQKMRSRCGIGFSARQIAAVQNRVRVTIPDIFGRDCQGIRTMFQAVRRLSKPAARVDFGHLFQDNKSMKVAITELVLDRWPYGLEIHLLGNGLVLRPRRKARAGWERAFRRQRKRSDEL